MRSISFTAIAWLVLSAIALMNSRAHLVNANRATGQNNLLDNPNIPRSVAVASTALGPLRGLAADAFFYRYAEKIEERDYHEATQLATLICTIQPNYASVWNYLAWDLSFNVAATQADPAQRWIWVQRGIRLLRDEALRANPQAQSIRVELARIFQDKIDGTDQNCLYFQNAWINEMLPLFERADRSELAELAAAPDWNAALVSDDPLLAQLQKNAERLGLSLLDQTRLPPPAPLQHAAFLTLLLGAEPSPQQLDSLDRSLRKLRQSYIRHRLEQEYKMDLVRAQWVDDHYGPLDWRTHQAQIIYYLAVDDFDKLQVQGLDYTRSLRGAMLSSLYNGRIIYQPGQASFARTWNLAMLPRLHTLVEQLRERERDKPAGYAQIDAFHRTFVQSSITICYNANQSEAARELFAHYKEYPDVDPKLSFEDFILASMEATLKRGSIKETRALIASILTDALRSLMAGDQDRYNGLTNKAMMLYLRHQQLYGGTGSTLPPFKEIVQSARAEFAQAANLSAEEIQKNAEKASQIKRQRIDTFL